MKWISVKDRLPEYRGPANFDDKSTVLAYYQRPGDDSNFHVVLVGGGFEPSADGITGYTHWMPLPPPPTTDQRGTI